MEDRAISLNAVIDVMHEMWGDSGELLDAIKELPSVTTEKTGHWILTIEDWNKWTCSECGWSTRTDIHVKLGYDFCPKCGADMIEPQESEG